MAGAAPGSFRIAVSSLPVAPSVRSVRPLLAERGARADASPRVAAPFSLLSQKLEAAGFGTRGDLENIGPVDLARGTRASAVAAALTTLCVCHKR